MNAARYIAQRLPRAAHRRLLRKAGLRGRVAAASAEGAWRRTFELDLVALLNAMRKAELETIAESLEVDRSGSVSDLRMRLWWRLAELEAGGTDHLGTPWQPTPSQVAHRLCILGPVRGLAPPAALLPREVPMPPASMVGNGDEPECLEDLLARADALVGVRLGRPIRDKGHFGAKVARLLGVVERGDSEPDWRGEVELKTVPVVCDHNRHWRVKEDPAIAMEGIAPERKLGRVLWIARVADLGDSPILSWYYQEWDPVVAELARRHLHRRPKGPAGTDQRGWYLQKSFFAGSGFLRTLNGP